MKINYTKFSELLLMNTVMAVVFTTGIMSNSNLFILICAVIFVLMTFLELKLLECENGK